MVLFALVALAFAEETKKAENTKKDKRGLYGALGYGYGLDGYSYGGLNSYSSLPLGLSPSLSSTILTKEVAVPVPQPVAVPVEKHVPVPVKVPILVRVFALLDYTCKTCENSSATCTWDGFTSCFEKKVTFLRVDLLESVRRKRSN